MPFTVLDGLTDFIISADHMQTYHTESPEFETMKQKVWFK